MDRRSVKNVMLAIGLLVAAIVAVGAAATMAGETQTSPGRETATATFAGGCFWCMEPPFDKLDGVLSTTSGYIGGAEREPTYKEVSAGSTGHAEAIEVVYDPARISYQELLEVFWRNIDPTTADRQFCDWGSQYRTAVFTHGEAQHLAATASKEKLEATKPFAGPILTEVVAAGDFWPAEEYHQDYYKKNPDHYKRYRTGCGRDRRLAELWGESP